MSIFSGQSTRIGKAGGAAHGAQTDGDEETKISPDAEPDSLVAYPELQSIVWELSSAIGELKEKVDSLSADVVQLKKRVLELEHSQSK